MWCVTMKKHLKKSAQSSEPATALEEQTLAEATLVSTEITPTLLGTSIEELSPTEMLAPLALSSSKLDQPLHPKKRLRCLRHGYEPGSFGLITSLSPL